MPRLGRSPGEGTGSPLQCSGLENPMDCMGSPGVEHDWATFTHTQVNEGWLSSLSVEYRGLEWKSLLFISLLWFRDPKETAGRGWRGPHRPFFSPLLEPSLAVLPPERVGPQPSLCWFTGCPAGDAHLHGAGALSSCIRVCLLVETVDGQPCVHPVTNKKNWGTGADIRTSRRMR